ncbi:MAG TPA: hypothetical protein VMY42_09155 [Thermoguttaceae bacterium]|nr:hypothetical protein [Thermoguttaceae bacterium]
MLVGKSPLTPPRMSPDSVVLEIFFVRFPFGDPEANEQLWEEVDEQHLPAEVRRGLARNGFRTGIVGGQLPVTLARLLELRDRPNTPEGESRASLWDMKGESRLLPRRLQIRAAQRGEIVVSGVYDRLPVLLCEGGQLFGQTYSKAQGILAVETFPQHDGRVRVELTPEIHHGEMQQRWVGKQEMLRLEASRHRRVFEDLGISATLSPGSVLVVGSLPDRVGSLGHHFFTEGDNHREQKLLVVRLAQTQHNGLFSPSRILPLGE